jgi:hypothetical protein
VREVARPLRLVTPSPLPVLGVIAAVLIAGVCSAWPQTRLANGYRPSSYRQGSFGAVEFGSPNENGANHVNRLVQFYCICRLIFIILDRDVRKNHRESEHGRNQITALLFARRIEYC